MRRPIARAPSATVLKNGAVYGTLCCFSHAARPELGEGGILGLQDVANVIAAGIEHPSARSFE